jgi:hypothetical protein
VFRKKETKCKIYKKQGKVTLFPILPRRRARSIPSAREPWSPTTGAGGASKGGTGREAKSLAGLGPSRAANRNNPAALQAEELEEEEAGGALDSMRGPLAASWAAAVFFAAFRLRPTASSATAAFFFPAAAC